MLYLFHIRKGVLYFIVMLFSGFFIKFAANILKIANVKKIMFNAGYEIC